MKKKLFSILALVLVAMSASAVEGYTLSVGTSEHGTIAFKVGTNEKAEYANEGDVVTVTITPATGYVVNQPSGQWIAAVAAARSNAPANIDLLKDVELTAAGTNTWTFTMQRANVEISATYKKLLTNQDITVTIDAVTYTGQTQKPTVTVKDGTTSLVLNTDYTVTYSDNVNAGTATATITAVSTSEKYSGTATKTFTINPKALEDSFIADIAAVTYNSQEQKPAPVLTYNGKTLVENTDYTVAYSDNVNVGTAKVTATGTGNYSGTASKTFTINKAPLSAVTLDPATLEYNRAEQTVSVTGVSAGSLAVDLSDCTVSGNSGTDAGTYTVTVTANESAVNFTGSATADFTIIPKPITDDMVTVEGATYTGEALTPAVTVTDGSAVLTEGTEYSVSYSNNTEIGDASVTVSGMGNYGGSVSTTFAILPNIPDVEVDASEDNKGDEEVDDVKMKMKVTDYHEITKEERTFTDPKTGEEVTKEVYVAPVELSEISIPAQEEVVNPETGEKEEAEITVYIPATFVSADGSTLFEVTRIGANAIKSDTESAIVSTIVLPDTKKAIQITEGALAVDNLPADDSNHRVANIRTSLSLLDDYTTQVALKENLEHGKVSAHVEPPHKYWTLSSGVDVELGADVRVFTCKSSGDDEVAIKELLGDDLLLANGAKGVKANNGVLIAFTNGFDGNATDVVASPTNVPRIGTVPSTDNARSYENNALIPVIVEQHFAPSSIYILAGNEFHELSQSDNTEVPACKAVMPRTSSSQGRRLSITVGGDTTGIGVVEHIYGDGENSQWYDLKGNRIERPTQKGVYILNGNKVVIK